MSGHSKWSTIKRQKEANDSSRGKVFGKLAKAISIAARNGADPDSNPKLRVVIEQAKAVNMPKTNIERAIAKAAKQDVQMEEVSYEGFGPGGIGVIVEAATDNRNRTAAEIKSIFDRGGGSLGGPGSVSFNFDPKGYIAVEKGDKTDEDILRLIDLGIEEVEEEGGIIELYTTPSELSDIKKKVEDLDYKIKDVALIKKPKSYLLVEDRDMAKKMVTLLEKLEDHDDVQKVYANADIATELGN